MKYLLLLMLATTAIAGPKFRYGQRVRVVDGFYNSCTGMVLDFKDETYAVQLHCKDTIPSLYVVRWIDGVNLISLSK